MRGVTLEWQARKVTISQRERQHVELAAVAVDVNADRARRPVTRERIEMPKPSDPNKGGKGGPASPRKPTQKPSTPSRPPNKPDPYDNNPPMPAGDDKK